jgi:hypothetical protein
MTDLTHHDALQTLEVIDNKNLGFYGINMKELLHCRTDNHLILTFLESYVKLEELELNDLGSYIEGSLSQLKILKIIHGMLTENLISRIPMIRKIELFDVGIDFKGWCKFVDSLITLSQSVSVKTRCMWFTNLEHEEIRESFEILKSAMHYIKERKNEFVLSENGILEFETVK